MTTTLDATTIAALAQCLRTARQASQITEPAFAPLMGDLFFAAGGDISIDRFIAPRVEVELALVPGRSLRGPA